MSTELSPDEMRIVEAYRRATPVQRHLLDLMVIVVEANVEITDEDMGRLIDLIPDHRLIDAARIIARRVAESQPLTVAQKADCDVILRAIGLELPEIN